MIVTVSPGKPLCVKQWLRRLQRKRSAWDWEIATKKLRGFKYVIEQVQI